eukprot:symbB.v1.2.025960.t2/scaffold2556.1/size76420/6
MVQPLAPWMPWLFPPYRPALFEGNAEEVFQEAEENLPQVLFDTGKVQVAYRGREWLQRLLNTLGDDRGRNPVQDALSKTDGTWLYMFPTLQGQDTLLDYKELPDAQLGHGKLARWHHAHAFVDLRRLLAPCKGPELEFRAYLTQVDTAMPGEFPESEWPAAYQPCRSYVKGVISLDRPLERLCPRDLQPAVTVSGEAYIPPPPAKRPPPTVNEELEKEAAAIIARLSFEFARWCYDSGYIESKIVGPGGELSPNPVLGKKGVVRRAFLQWLEQDSEGASLKDLGNALRPAVVRLMRAENKNGPACGLCGNENDAKYTYLRDYIARHMFRALNNEVEANRRKRDEQIWRSPQENAQDADAADSWQKQDAMLKRLTVEYELVGNWHRAREVYEEWLALETNVENGQAWFSFARFLMRTGAHQLDAEGVLRYAISLRTEEEGPDLQEVAFLACLLENHRLPSSLDEGGRSARFQAALAMMEAYADRNAFERLPMHIIFLLYAAEAEGLRQMAAADGMSEEQAMQLAEESDRLSAEASKYLELARTSPEKWQGTLEVMPSFPELTQLTTKESLNRGNSTEVPSEVPETPAAWRPSVAPRPFPDAEALRTKAETEDAMALQVIDLLLHFGISDLAGFLLEGAVQAYGYLSPVTVQSERCQLQMVKVAMLAKDWGKVETLFSDLFSRRGGDRWPEAHALLGECRYRAARDKGATNPFHYHFATKPIVHAMAGGRAQRARALAATARGNMPLHRLGGVEDALNISAMQRHGINAVLNTAYSGCLYSLLSQSTWAATDAVVPLTTRPFSAAWYEGELGVPTVAFLAIDAEDSPQYPISGHFTECTDFLSQCRQRGRKVLVHCVAGQNRSATICAAFMMHPLGFAASLDEATKWISSRRPGVLQNCGFLRQLMTLEESGRDDKEVPLSDRTTTLQSVEPPTALLGDVQEHPVPDSDGTVKTVVLVQRPPSRFKAMCSGEKNGVGYASALQAFETALCFMTEETSGPKQDPVLQLRVGSILHLKSEEENFSDAAVAERAVKHYKKSAMVAPTAEAWKNIGLCRYRQVKLQATTSRKEKKLKEAMKYFQEANVLDRERPDILAWLTICAVELGLVQVAKQGFRQLMQFEERLETPVALELASLLLRFSNEQRAADWGGERGRLVQNGRYSKEAAMLSKVILGRGEDAPRARNILAWCKFLDGDHGAAAGEFCASMSAADDPEFLEEAAYMARHCASMIPGEPQLAALVEEERT